MLLLLLAVDIFGSVLGIFATSAAQLRTNVAAISSGIFCGVALIWMLPEMGQVAGWHDAGIALTAGLAVLCLVDRFVCPVCPCCTHGHHHSSDDRTSTRLLVPLVTGICLHNFFDGWSTQVASASSGNLGMAMLAGNLVHKAPESVVLGLLLQSRTKDSTKAAGLAMFASLFLVIGGAAQAYSASFHSRELFIASLGFAAAGFLFVGVHLFRAECARSGRRAAAWSLVTGFAAAAVVERAVALLTTS